MAHALFNLLSQYDKGGFTKEELEWEIKNLYTAKPDFEFEGVAHEHHMAKVVHVSSDGIKIATDQEPHHVPFYFEAGATYRVTIKKLD